jgi:hypothetical protein
VVRCPTCAGQVVVPDPAAPGAEKPAPENPAAPLFERSDFDDLFGGLGRKKEPPDPKDRLMPAASLPELAFPAPPPAPRPGAPPVNYDVERLSLPPVVAGPVVAAAPGIVLSPAKATLLTVAAIIALGLAFTAGLIVGLILRS